MFANGDTGSTLGHRDGITDFTPGTDKIDLTGLDGDSSTSGTRRSASWARRRSTARPGALHTSYEPPQRDGAEGDTNGDKVADFGIDLTGNLTLRPVDFTTGSLLLPVNATATGQARRSTAGRWPTRSRTVVLRSVTMVGGAGNDTYMVDNAGDVVTEREPPSRRLRAGR